MDEGSKSFSFCEFHLESMQHVLWNCMVHVMFGNMLHLIDVAYGPIVITWGNAFCMDVNVQKNSYEREKILLTY